MDIKLSKFKEADFDKYFSLVSNIRVMAKITERSIPHDEAKINFKTLIDRNKEENKFGTFKILDCFNENFIGLGHITLNKENKNEAEIGYMILPEYWGKGYGTEIAKQLIRIARKEELKVLKAIIDPNNIPSRKILIKYGFESVELCKIDGLPGEILCKSLL